jgi:uncharacterized UPF0160 family protein
VYNATKGIWGDELNEEQIESAYQRVYRKLILEVDAIDNGVKMTTEKPRYSINSGLAARIGRLNWSADLNCDQ